MFNLLLVSVLFCGILLSMIKMTDVTANIAVVMIKTKAINIQILKTNSFLPLMCWHIFVCPQWSQLMDILFEILTKTETEFVFEYFVLAVLVAVQVYVPESVGWRLLNVILDLWWGSSICSSDLFSNWKLQVKTGGGLLSALHSIVRESPTQYTDLEGFMVTAGMPGPSVFLINHNLNDYTSTTPCDDIFFTTTIHFQCNWLH